MGALQQYLSLYDDNLRALEGAAPRALNARRRQSRELLGREGMALPGRHEGHEHTSLEAMYAPDYGVNINRLALHGTSLRSAAAFRCGAGVITPWALTVANDVVVMPEAMRPELPEGVYFGPMSKAPEELLGRWYGTVADKAHAETLLNTMLAGDGVLVYVPYGVRLERPLQIVNLNAAPVDTLSLRRVLVVAGKESKVDLLLCDHVDADKAHAGRRYLNSQVMEVVCGRGSEVNIYDIEETTPDTSRNWLVYAEQREGSQLRVDLNALRCGVTRNDISVALRGEHCLTRLFGMAVGSDRMHIDTDTRVVHGVPRCKSEQLFKYVLDDDATGSFEGRVVVSAGAAGTDARQTNRNLLASYGARMHTKPQLEIYNDDVKCSHGSTTGQLDESALFYMEQRGIPRREARTMLMQAFLMDVIDNGVGIESLRQRIRHMAERRFAGDDMCLSCLNLQDPKAADD